MTLSADARALYDAWPADTMRRSSSIGRTIQLTAAAAHQAALELEQAGMLHRIDIDAWRPIAQEAGA